MSNLGFALEDHTMSSSSSSSTPDADYFSSYEWCLNPLQTFSALCARSHEVLGCYRTLDMPWQREEARRNLYLLLCAACCTIDDYLAHRPCDLSPVVRHLPRIGGTVRFIENAVNAAAALGRVAGDGSVRQVRRALADCVDCICGVLVAATDDSAQAWIRLRAAMQLLSCGGLPAKLLGWRARIPEAFRCQDLSHYDAVAMGQRFLDESGADLRPVIVIGLRTAGAYLAPLINAFLVAHGFPTLGWMSIRPRVGMSRQERRQFLHTAAAAGRILVVDDYPNTGGTLAKALAILNGLGLSTERIVILAPSHPAQLDWARAVGNAKLMSLSFGELYKQKLLNSNAAITRILRDLCCSQGWTHVAVQNSPAVDRLNTALTAQLGSTFEVRLKRLYRVHLRRNGEPPVERLVLAKSVGWGWLGYHAVLASSRLQDFVPRLIGFRDGFLFSEWVGSVDVVAPMPERAQIIPVLGRYIAARVNRLRLEADPNVTTLGGRPAGWDTLLRIIRHPYGRVVGRLVGSQLQAQLACYHAPQPTLVDGAMGPSEWVISDASLVKVDFEHHNFGGAQQDVVDGCYDLASAIRDLDIDEAEEAALLADYTRQTGDGGASERLPLYKILCGVAEMRKAAYCVVRAASRDRQESWNCRYNRARDFLNIHMARHCARSARPQATPAWSSQLFFLDLDGVFDAELLWPLFQHTTPAGLESLSLLRAGGYSVVLNTARSVEQVKNYCTIYSLPGGVAEYGSVFFDAVTGNEIPLVDAQAMQQIEQCRARLNRMKDVFVDPGYRWSLRAYRYRGDLTVGLSIEELQQLLAGDLDRLSFVARDADSHIVQMGVDKGTSASFVKAYLPQIQRPVVAMGDAAPDLCMFAETDIAYVPANFDPMHRNALRGRKYRILRASRQRALLAAASELTGCIPEKPAQSGLPARHLLDHILYTLDQPMHRRLLNLLGRRRRYLGSRHASPPLAPPRPERAIAHQILGE